MSTLSNIVESQGFGSAADIDWLHMLVGDWQLISDLAFADIVLWIPTTDGSFVAVAHARPSSSATLFYRDLVGQKIKPEWKAQVSEAYETGKLIESSSPAWFEETPTRVRAVPVMRRIKPGTEEKAPVEPIAVISLHTNLSENRTPSRQELTFNACATDHIQFKIIPVIKFPRHQLLYLRQ